MRIELFAAVNCVMLLASGASSSSITVAQLCDILRNQNTTVPQAGRVKYTVHRKTDPAKLRLPAGLMDSLMDSKKRANMETAMRARADCTLKKVLTFDMSRGRWRVDTREVGASDGPSSRIGGGGVYANVSRDEVFQGRHSMYYTEEMRHIVVHERANSRQLSLLNFLDFGIQRPEMIDMLSKTDAKMEEGELLRVTIPLEGGAGDTWVIDLDPNIGYRCRHNATYRAGSLLYEVEIGDYREIDGHWVPFYGRSTVYESNGELGSLKEVHVEGASFRVAIGDGDFCFRPPVGVRVVCGIAGMNRGFRIESEEPVSIDSLLRRLADVGADQVIEDLVLKPLSTQSRADVPSPVVPDDSNKESGKMKVNEPPSKQSPGVVDAEGGPRPRGWVSKLLVGGLVAAMLGTAIALRTVCHSRRRRVGS